MSIRRIGVLLGKEVIHGSKGFFFIFAMVAPLVFSLFINLIFGSLFSEKPKLGIVDQGRSQIVDSLSYMKSINLKKYSSERELKNAVETGARDVGVVLQEDFDSMIQKGETIRLTAYVWGESHLKNRAIVGSAILYRVRNVSGKKAPVDITPVSLGEKNAVSWEERLLPLLVLMAIFISGFIIPSSSLVEEKQKRTIGAVLTTPATQSDIFVSKGLLGSFLSIVMGFVILLLNTAFNEQIGLIIVILFLGAIMASCFGLLLGAFMSDMASLYSAIKGFNLILYGPGLVTMFPQIPQWIGKLFPTYYVMNPIMEITRKGGGWSTVKLDVLILIGLIAVFIAVVGIVANKTRQQEA